MAGSAHRSAGIFSMTLEDGHGLFHLGQKGKGRVTKVTGVSKSSQLVRGGGSTKAANCTQDSSGMKCLGREVQFKWSLS